MTYDPVAEVQGLVKYGMPLEEAARKVARRHFSETNDELRNAFADRLCEAVTAADTYATVLSTLWEAQAAIEAEDKRQVFENLRRRGR